MPARVSFDYATVRVVPSLDRGEFVNAGVIVHAPSQRFVGAQVAVPCTRVRALYPNADVDAVERQLCALRAVAEGAADAGPVARLSPAERFHFLVAPRSTIVQISPVHTGLCDDPARTLRDLYATLVDA